LNEANVLVPGDRTTLALLQKANKGLEDQRRASAKLQKLEEESRKAEQVRRLFGEARQALKAKKYEQADRLLTELVKQVPNDPDIIGLRKDLDAARKGIADEKARLDKVKADEKARADAEAARQKRLADFDAKMKAGQTAMTAKKFDDAIKAYTEALKLVKDQKPFVDQEKKASAALEGAKKAKEKDDKLKLKLGE
jgi:tetratricopeptide (TPR) repeat protein